MSWWLGLPPAGASYLRPRRGPVLAIVLGPLAEPALRQSLIGSHGDVMIFVQRPISGTIMGIAAVLILVPIIKILRQR